MDWDFGDRSPRLGLPYLAAGQMQKHITLNEALARLDYLVQPQAVSRTVAAQPGAPETGVFHIVPEGATGADWSVFAAGDLVRFDGVGWSVEPSPDGMMIHVADEDAVLTRHGGVWRPLSGGGGGVSGSVVLDQLGVNTAPDAINPVAIRAPKVLMTAVEAEEGGDGDLRLTLNKQAPADVASVLLQSDFEGRAEIGLIGTDDFTFKVSADGVHWTSALALDKASGAMSLAGVGPLVRPETVAALNAFTMRPTRRRAFLIDDLISDLIEAGVWERLDLFYLLAAHDAQAARINLKAPGVGALTPSGGPNFTIDRGYQGDGVSAHLKSGTGLSSLSHYSVNDASLFVWSLTDVAGSSYGDIGTTTGLNTALFTRSGSNNIGCASNTAGTFNLAVTDSLGLAAWSRTGPTATAVYRHGEPIGNSPAASTTMGAGEVVLLRAGSTYSIRRLAAAGAGASLGMEHHRALQAALSTFLRAVGAVS